jgi:hypothetical protein
VTNTNYGTPQYAVCHVCHLSYFCCPALYQTPPVSRYLCCDVVSTCKWISTVRWNILPPSAGKYRTAWRHKTIVDIFTAVTTSDLTPSVLRCCDIPISAPIKNKCYRRQLKVQTAQTNKRIKVCYRRLSKFAQRVCAFDCCLRKINLRLNATEPWYPTRHDVGEQKSIVETPVGSTSTQESE